MGKVKFELDLAGLNELMKGPEMQSVLSAAGKAVASAAGQGYAERTHVASFVAISNVYPNTKEAAHENYEKNTLVKALGAAGLKM